jgi:hypothetical protein
MAKSPSWLDTLEGAGRTIVPSTLENIKDMAKGVLHTVAHPVQAAHALGDIGTGIASKAAPYLGSEALVGKQNPQKKAQQEAVADAAWANIADKYSKVDQNGNRRFDMDTFKHTLATNPGGILADASSFLPFAGEAGVTGKLGKAVSAAGDLAENSGATGAALKAAQAAQKAGSGIQSVGQGVSTAARAANPLAVPIAAARKVVPAAVNAVGATPARWQQLVSRVPNKLLSTAYQAGKASDVPLNGSESAGQIFKRFSGGQGSTEEIQQTAMRALNQIRQDASNTYLQGKAGLARQPVDYQGALDALTKSEKELHMGSSQGFQAAKDAIDKARGMVEDVVTNPDPVAQNIDNADALKRQIWDLRNSEPNAVAKDHLGKIYNAVKSSISDTDPDYAKLMESYQSGLQNIQDLNKTLGLNDRTANTAALAKQLRAIKTPAGDDLLDQISDKEPSLPFMLAGHVAQDHNPGAMRAAMDVGLLYGAAHQGLPATVTQGAGQAAALASAAMSSPSVALGTNYALGKVAGTAGRIADKLPTPIAAAGRDGANIAKGAIPSAETGTALAGQLSREEENKPLTPEEAGINPKAFTGTDVEPSTDESKPEEDQGITLNDAFGVPEATDRPQRASGGAVKHIEHLVERLMRQAKHEKKSASKHTEHLLKIPDNAIAKALAITKKAIV